MVKTGCHLYYPNPEISWKEFFAAFYLQQSIIDNPVLHPCKRLTKTKTKMYLCKIRTKKRNN